MDRRRTKRTEGQEIEVGTANLASERTEGVIAKGVIVKLGFSCPRVSLRFGR